MEPYEMEQKNKRIHELIDLIDNDLDKGTDWFDHVPEIAALCLDMDEETKDPGYKEILTNILGAIDAVLVNSIKVCKIENKETLNILRLKVMNHCKRLGH
jgi:hypothetical protein